MLSRRLGLGLRFACRLDTVNPGHHQDTLVEVQLLVTGLVEDTYNELRRILLEPNGLAFDPHPNGETAVVLPPCSLWC